MITVGGQTLTITQAPNPASCSFALNPNNWTYGPESASGSFSVTTQAGCRWTAAANVGWLTVTGGSIGAGNGTVNFNVQANSGGSRTGGISVSGQVFTITQCGYVVEPTSYWFESGGGAGVITVSSVAAGCSWTATSNAGWITIISGASGVGNGTVEYRVSTLILPAWSQV